MADDAHAVTARRWRRYGKDRVYVNDGETALGYLDLASRQTTVAVPERAADVHAAIQQYVDDHPDLDRLSRPPGQPAQARRTEDARPTNAPAPTQPRDAGASDVSAGRDRPSADRPRLGSVTTDLAANKAGAAAQARARELDGTHPILNRIARALDIPTASASWHVGARGEKLVGRELDKLERQGWRHIDAIPVGERGSDIDHLLVGPGGVFTINTKHHPGKNVWLADRALLVGGTKTPYLRNSRHEAARAAKLLVAAWGFRVPVTPMIVLVGIHGLTVKSTPPDIVVLTLEDLRRWVISLPDILDQRTTDSIHAVARRPATWTDSS